ncbi:MAG: DUF6538 domain-containing protein [Sphingomonadales bacterium]
MSGPRPVHLHRRGAVYAVRFRIPLDLCVSLGVVELRRSLQTADFDEARRRCLKATIWFRATMDKLRANLTASRADLEYAAQVFFAQLTDARLRPLHIPESAVHEVG